MKTQTAIVSVIITFIALFGLQSSVLSAAIEPADALPTQPAPDAPLHMINFGPLAVENVGQFDDEVRYQLWGGSATTWITDDAIWLSIVEPDVESENTTHNLDRIGMREPWDEPEPERPATITNLRISFVNANPAPKIEPYGLLDTKFNYFKGNDPEQWRSDVRVWSGVRYVDLYPGLDLVIGQEEGDGKITRPTNWRLVANGNADDVATALAAIQMRIEGAEQVTAIQMSDEQPPASLRLANASSESVLSLLHANDLFHPSQVLHSKKSEIPIPQSYGDSFLVSQPITVFDKIQSLTTPMIGGPNWSTFLGGGNDDYGNSIALAQDDEVVIVGETWSTNFPVSAGAFDSYLSGNFDSYLLRLSATGQTLLYSTFIGGSYTDSASSVAVTRNDEIVVVGRTGSPNFPTTVGAYDTTYNGGYWDGYVLQLAASGGALRYSTLFGGNNDDYGFAAQLASDDEVVVTGITYSTNFPTTSGAYDTTYNGNGDGYVLRFASDGGSLHYSTLFGGSGTDEAFGIALALDGEVMVGGYTSSTNFPTTAGAYNTYHNGGLQDGYVLRLAADGSNLRYSTYFGGDSNDYGYSITLAQNDEVVVGGMTYSTNFPTTSGVYDATYNGSGDSYVLRLTDDGGSLHYSTLFGGVSLDKMQDVALTQNNEILVVGYTYSENFPTTTDAYDTHHGGQTDGYVLRLSPNADTLLYSTFIGDNESDIVKSGALANDGKYVIVGSTNSPGFPTNPNAYDTQHNGYDDGFAAQMDIGVAPRTFALDIQIHGNGTVSKNPNKSRYSIDELVTLTATASLGWQFSRWDGDISGTENPENLIMDDDKSVVTIFTPICYRLTRTYTGSGSNPITSPANSGGCNANEYYYQRNISLRATPSDGWEVSGWSGTDNDASTSISNSVTMPASNHTIHVFYEQATHYMHLPIVTNYPPPTPFPTLVNAAFDAGVTGWSQSSLNNLPLIVHEDDLPSGVAPYSRPWQAWLGGRTKEIADLSQTFTIPGQYTDLRLHLYYWIGAQETTCGDDMAWVRINDDTLWTICLFDDNETDGWKPLELNLGDYAGQTVTLHFYLDLNGDEQNSNWFIDDVTLCDNSSAHPCP